MANKNDKQFKSHKIYRWIALFVKLISLPLLNLAFIGLTRPMTLPISQGQSTLGHFLALLISLILYFSIIFILNRKFNFYCKTDLKKSIAVYVLVALFLFSIELIYANPLKNYIYKLTKLGLKDGATVASFATVNNIWAYLGINLGVTLLFSTISKNVIFLLFKKVLTKDNVLAKI